MPDIRVENHGSIVLLQPLTLAGTYWLEETVINKDTLLWGSAVVVEPRYAARIVEGMISEGLEVEG